MFKCKIKYIKEKYPHNNAKYNHYWMHYFFTNVVRFPIINVLANPFDNTPSSENKNLRNDTSSNNSAASFDSKISENIDEDASDNDEYFGSKLIISEDVSASDNKNESIHSEFNIIDTFNHRNEIIQYF